MVLFLPISLLANDAWDYENTGGWGFKLRGSYKNLFIYQEKKEVGADLQRVRLSPKITYGEDFVFYVDIDNQLIGSNQGKVSEFERFWKEDEYNSFLHLSRTAYQSEEVCYQQKIHRFYFKYSFENFIFSLGRQQVRFGSGRLWNPLDILNPVDPAALEGAGEQAGTDALRLDWYPDDLSELAIVYNPKRSQDKIENLDGESSNYLLRLKSRDYALLLGWVAKRAVSGFDLSADLLDGNLRAALLAAKPQGESCFVQASAGYEYTFANGLYLLLEQFYNQRALGDDEDLAASYEDFVAKGFSEDNYYILSNRILTSNRFYSGVALGYDFFPLLGGDLFLVCDIEGAAVLAMSSLTASVWENLDVCVGAMMAKDFGTGKSSDFEPFLGNNLWTASLKFYF